MFIQHSLTQEQLTMIWENCRSDESLLIELYKILSSISRGDELEFFLNKILSQDISKMRG
jgi:hypothetical protein